MNRHHHTKFRIRIFQLFALACGFFISTTSSAETIEVGRFSLGHLDDWEEEIFNDQTRYTLINDADIQYLQAISQASASGLVRKMTINLEKTPYLNWSWRTDKVFESNNERLKEGDDYPARIYIIVSGGWLFWKTQALNYVWSSNQVVGSHWPNAYTANAHMLAIRSGPNQQQQWRSEKRNVRQDLKTYFGKDITEVHAVAVMTDSDDTGEAAQADYGDIYFSSE